MLLLESVVEGTSIWDDDFDDGMGFVPLGTEKESPEVERMLAVE
jgi:hypothetical protein